MKKVKKKPFVPGLVRGQLVLRSPLRDACKAEIVIETSKPERAILDYPNHAETPNEASKRQLARLAPKMKKQSVPFTLKTGDWIL